MLFRQAAAPQELESKRGREAGPRSAASYSLGSLSPFSFSKVA